MVLSLGREERKREEGAEFSYVRERREHVGSRRQAVLDRNVSLERSVCHPRVPLVCSSHVVEAIGAALEVGVQEVNLVGVEPAVCFLQPQVKHVSKKVVRVVWDNQFSPLFWCDGVIENCARQHMQWAPYSRDTSSTAHRVSLVIQKKGRKEEGKPGREEERKTGKRTEQATTSF